MKKFKELIFEQDTIFDESIEVEESIKCKNGNFSIKVAGNIYAGNINARNIDALDIDALDINAWNINARNINARNINARNIDALDINAWNIVCEKRIKKTEKCTTKARIFIQEKSKLKRKEWEV